MGKKVRVNAAASMAKTEAQWRAESDARTLMDAERVKADPARLARAKVELRKMVADAKASIAAGERAGK